MSVAIRNDENFSDIFMLGVKESDVDHKLGVSSADLIEERKVLAQKVHEDPHNPTWWKRLLENCKHLYKFYPSQVERLYRRAISCLRDADGDNQDLHVPILLDFADLLSSIPNRKRAMLRQTLNDGIANGSSVFFEYYAKFEISQDAQDKAISMLDTAVAKSMLDSVERDRIWANVSKLASPNNDMQNLLNNTTISTPMKLQSTPLIKVGKPITVPSTVSKLSGISEGVTTPLSRLGRNENRARTAFKPTRLNLDNARLGKPMRVLKSETMSQDSDKENDDPRIPIKIQPETPLSKSSVSIKEISYIKEWSPSRHPLRTPPRMSSSIPLRPIKKEELLKRDLDIEVARSDEGQKQGQTTDSKVLWRSPRIETTPARNIQDQTTIKSRFTSPFLALKKEEEPIYISTNTKSKRSRYSPDVYRKINSQTPPQENIQKKQRTPDDDDMDITSLMYSNSPVRVGMKRQRSPDGEDTAIKNTLQQGNTSYDSIPKMNAMPSAIERLIDTKNHIKVNGIVFINLKQIGSGGTSKVFRVLGPDMQIYALKKIKMKKMDEHSIRSYENEINLLKSLQGSPHIIKLLANETDYSQQLFYVVMEIGEIDLMNKLKELKQNHIIIEENFLRIVWQQMLQAVNYIHSKRVIHGDLKPANFLFVNGALKLIDFGIAKAISNDTTNVVLQQVEGTANYMPPEVAASSLGQGNTLKKVGRAGDIWSLGCILYQIVYGDTPFGMITHMIQKLLTIADPKHSIQFPTLKNKHLAQVIRSCLQWDSKLRPSIEGSDGLLAHPFLNSFSNDSTSPLPSEEDVCSVVDRSREYIEKNGSTRNITRSVSLLVETIKSKSRNIK